GGSADTPIIENILPLDLTVASSTGAEWFLHHDRGSDASARDFEPLEEHLRPGGSTHLESSGGDPSSKNTLPFFNLQTTGHGFIGAVGWTGNWKADFTYSADSRTMRIRAGMLRTRFLLHPGEQVRTPRIVLM